MMVIVLLTVIRKQHEEIERLRRGLYDVNLAALTESRALDGLFGGRGYKALLRVHEMAWEVLKTNPQREIDSIIKDHCE